MADKRLPVVVTCARNDKFADFHIATEMATHLQIDENEYIFYEKDYKIDENLVSEKGMISIERYYM